MDIKNKVFNGHVLTELAKFPDNCLDCCVTSPPYFSARFYGVEDNTIWDGDKECVHEWQSCTQSKVSYSPMSNKSVDNISKLEGHNQSICIKCGAFFGQLGQEPSPMLFIKHLADIFDEIKRCLKPTGVLFLNIGDTYCGSQGGFADKTPNPKSRQSKYNGYFASSVIAPPAFTCIGKEKWLVPKQLMQIPNRLAIEMQDRGWILRQDIIWHKVSGLPSTANDRFNSKYEHIFMFVKEPYYFFDTAKARKPYKENSLTRKLYRQASLGGTGIIKCASTKGESEPTFVPANDKGALKDDVWEIHTANTNLKHFAAFSGDLVKECILPGCAKECCDICGSPKMEKYKIINREYKDLTDNEIKIWNSIDTMDVTDELKAKMRTKVLKKKISLGFIQSCKCENTTFSPGITFDPFCGTGTTIIEAKKLGYNYSGIEMKPEYFSMINKRLEEMLQ